MFLSFWRCQGVVIETDEPSDPEIWVAGDPSWLHRALTNLLINAIEACSHGGKVNITTRVLSPTDVHGRFPEFRGQALSIRVTDDGHGIQEQDRERTFKPFHTTKTSGTGLGLAVVLDAVETHGGTIEVTSVLDRGSSFEVLLPLVDPLAVEPDLESQYPCGDRPGGIAPGCWLSRGHEHYVRTGSWRAHCLHCAVFLRSNLRHCDGDRLSVEPMVE